MLQKYSFFLKKLWVWANNYSFSSKSYGCGQITTAFLQKAMGVGK
jgi:hypothetical protein